MKRLLITSLLGLAVLGLSPVADAHVNLDIGIALPGIAIGPPVVYAPPQPYYAPPVVVYGGGGGYYGDRRGYRGRPPVRHGGGRDDHRR